MTMSNHKFATCLSFGTDGEADYSEIDVVVTFDFTPGTPEYGRFSGPPENYDPGSPDEVENIKIVSPDVDKETAGMIEDKLLDECYEAMAQSAYEDIEALQPDDDPRESFE